MIPKFSKLDIKTRRKSHTAKPVGLVVFMSVSLCHKAGDPALDCPAEGYQLGECVRAVLPETSGM